MRIKSQLFDLIFYKTVSFTFAFFGFQIWKQKSPGQAWTFSIFRLLWSFAVFGILFSCKYLLFTDEELTLGNLRSSKLTVLGDSLLLILTKVRVFGLFIPIWILCYKKKQILDSFGRVDELLKPLHLNEKFSSWEIFIYVSFIYAAYGYYFIESIKYLAQLTVLQFEQWTDGLLFIKYMGTAILTFTCIFEFVLYCGQTVVKMEFILRQLRNLEHLPFLH